MQGNAPGGSYGPPAAQGPQPQPTAPVSPGAPLPPQPPKSSRLGVLLGLIAVLLAAAALVVSLVREPKAATPAASPAPSTTPTAAVPAEQVFVDDADRALCEAIAPLMREVSEENRVFAKLSPGSPEQGTAIPGYRALIEDWASRIQPVLNIHANPPRFLTRTLQAYIDDKLLYVELVQPGYVDPFDSATWAQASVDGGGPLGTCKRLGITWA
jgi:hypothetical protein